MARYLYIRGAFAQKLLSMVLHRYYHTEQHQIFVPYIFQTRDAAYFLHTEHGLADHPYMVDLDVGEFGDGGRLEQTGIIQPGAVECQKIQLAALQGGQAAAVDGGVPVQQQIAQLGHSGKDRETGIGEHTVLHAEVGETIPHFV